MAEEKKLSLEGGLEAEVEAVLARPDFELQLKQREDIPLRRALSILARPLCLPEGEMRWRAVRAMGIWGARLAQRDREAARNLVRRLMWNLNEESGSCAWGAAESLGEILAAVQAAQSRG